MRTLSIYLLFTISLLYQSLGFAACGPITNGIIDCAPTKISTTYVNAAGVGLIKTIDSNGSPNGGWLEISNSGAAAVSAFKTMYATALSAVTTQQNCWVRIIPQVSQNGFWTVDIIAITP